MKEVLFRLEVFLLLKEKYLMANRLAQLVKILRLVRLHSGRYLFISSYVYIYQCKGYHNNPAFMLARTELMVTQIASGRISHPTN